MILFGHVFAFSSSFIFTLFVFIVKCWLVRSGSFDYYDYPFGLVKCFNRKYDYCDKVNMCIIFFPRFLMGMTLNYT